MALFRNCCIISFIRCTNQSHDITSHATPRTKIENAGGFRFSGDIVNRFVSDLVSSLSQQFRGIRILGRGRIKNGEQQLNQARNFQSHSNISFLSIAVFHRAWARDIQVRQVLHAFFMVSRFLLVRSTVVSSRGLFSIKDGRVKWLRRFWLSRILYGFA